MTSRIYGWTQESVHCLNIIDIVFSDDKKVRNAWNDLYDKYCVKDPDEVQLKKIQNAQYKLLETIAKSLGYKDKVTWETIQNPYIPDGMIRQQQEQAASRQACNDILLNMQHMIPQIIRWMKTMSTNISRKVQTPLKKLLNWMRFRNARTQELH